MKEELYEKAQNEAAELTDEELDNVAGGGGTDQKRAYLVAAGDICDRWKCKNCHSTGFNRILFEGSWCKAGCGTQSYCMNCEYCHLVGSLFWCYNT